MGFDVADDVIVQNPQFMNWLTDTQGTPLFVNELTRCCSFIQREQFADASTDAFNFIKIEQSGERGGVRRADWV